MPERKIAEHVTISTEKVQGDDSYIKVRRFTVNETKEFQRISKDLTEKGSAYQKFVAAHVEEWNWVSDDGEPLPQPKDDHTVIGKLTLGEMVLLEDVLTGLTAPDEETLKN